jgi:glutathione synthase/RimK-type ligase-like ATP-grasp enzyme
MSLCILGQEKTESNLKLLEEAKKRFGSVFFVPIESIGVGLNKEFSIAYRTSNLLKFKAVLPRIPRRFYSYAYQLLSLFPSDAFMPIPPIAFLLASERFYMLTVLRKRGIPTLNLYLARSVAAATRILDSVEFPIVLRVPKQKTGVTVKGKTEARSIIEALKSLQQPVLIEDLVKDMVSVYVAKPEAVAAVKKVTKEQDVIFAEGSLKSHKLDIEVKHLALEVAEAIDTQIMRVDISLNNELRVVNIELNPGLREPSKVTGINIPEKIIENMHQNYKSHMEKPVLMKFFDDAKSVVKDVLRKK